ncbi:hypothetical protein HDC90_001009 [Pedobacter sp. AK013]|uniref:hypothetical protein n=1 Tax=Pedobacter sp. AK013 TaxID=2723071 RepID=UPI00160B183B|nr:hypothetical protein [Pedobacter sp. AK013]MBB6236397.1 hypothetical protein [Pedobacter sp. AK013]
MKFFFNVIFCSLFFSACLAQHKLESPGTLLNLVYRNQLAYYNTKIEDKDNYVSIINFAGKERIKITQPAKTLIKSGNFTILEGFSPAWGNFVGLIWSGKNALLYKRTSIDKRFILKKINLNSNVIKKLTGIDLYLFNKINSWDVSYINALKSKIGMSVPDGYNFIATKVTTNQGEKKSKIETIAFEQFIDEK